MYLAARVAFVGFGIWTLGDGVEGFSSAQPTSTAASVAFRTNLFESNSHPLSLQNGQSSSSLCLSKMEEVIEEVPTTMGAALRSFFAGRYNGPRSIVVAILGLVFWRFVSLSELPFSLSEAVVAVATIIFWSFQEHFLHKNLLHSKQVMWYGKQIHQQHHDKPYLHISIDPCPLMMGWMFTAGIIFAWLLPTTQLAWTATIAYATAGLFYEWSHYIVHTGVRFRRGSFWELLKRHHVQHHLVDSDNWFAFSIRAVDDIMGTNPSPKKSQE